MGNNKRTSLIFLINLFIFFIITSFPGIAISADKYDNKQEFKKEAKEQKNPYADAKITVKIIPSIKNTFGYDILLNGKTLVHQPNKPALPGNEGFTTKKKAQKVADFVVKKIRKNEMPPTVTVDDLKKMGVLK